MIMADPALQVNFGRAVNLYKDYIQQDIEQKVPSLTVAELKTNDSVGSAGGKQIEKRYYSRKEYAAMSHEDRYQLKRLREEEGKPNQQAKKPKTIAQMTVAKFMAEISNNLSKAVQDQE